MTSFGLLDCQIVSLLDGNLIVSASIVVVFHLNLNLFVQQIPILVLLASKICHCLLNLIISAFMPFRELIFIEFVDALLDKIGLVKTIFIHAYSFCFDM